MPPSLCPIRVLSPAMSSSSRPEPKRQAAHGAARHVLQKEDQQWLLERLHEYVGGTPTDCDNWSLEQIRPSCP